jgi:hypothetical protein
MQYKYSLWNIYELTRKYLLFEATYFFFKIVQIARQLDVYNKYFYTKWF